MNLVAALITMVEQVPPEAEIRYNMEQNHQGVSTRGLQRDTLNARAECGFRGFNPSGSVCGDVEHTS